MRTITVREETWKNLCFMKISLTAKTLDDVIDNLIKNYNANKKEKEVK